MSSTTFTTIWTDSMKSNPVFRALAKICGVQSYGHEVHVDTFETGANEFSKTLIPN